MPDSIKPTDSEEYRLGFIMGEVRALHGSIEALRLDLAAHQAKEELIWAEVMSLKVWRAWVIGASAAVAAIISVLAAFVRKFL